MEKNNRLIRDSRLPVNIPVVYFLNNKEGAGTIVNMSVSGIGMEVKQSFIEGDLIRIMFKITDVVIEFWGIVKNVEGNRLGVKYEEISTNSMDEINNYICNMLIKARKSSFEF